MHPQIGETVGDFELIKLIAQGGMSSVFLAFDRSFNRHVALKIPHERFFQNEKFVSRFIREAKAVAKLKHNNIVGVYSVGVHKGVPFFAMEHVEGKPLSAILADGPLSVDRALYYLKQIATAIGRAHEMHIIHRDIKPDNILIEPSGHARVTDFGVSKILSDGQRQALALVGTPQYMSPEICLGEKYDHRTDIYSMGILFFELVTGTPPFKGSTPVETMRKQVSEPPEFPTELKKKIPEKIQTIILKMLDKNPERRYPDIRSLLRDLERIQPTTEEQMLFPDSPVARQKSGTKNIRRFFSHINGLVKLPSPAIALTILFFLFSMGLLFMQKYTPIRTGPDRTFLSLINRSILPPKDFTASEIAGSADPIFDPAPSTDALIFPLLLAQPEQTKKAAPPPGISITSKPSKAYVYIDSDLRGETPLKLEGVAAGAHLVVLKLDGYNDYSTEIKLDGLKDSAVFHEFTEAETIPPRASSLLVDSEPDGATVYLDGRELGKTPLALPEVAGEMHVLKLKLQKYEEVTKRINIQPEETFRISFNLTREQQFGNLKINSVPQEAEIRLNGAYKGLTPSNLQRVPPGNYELILRKDGYQPSTKRVTCKANGFESIEVSLKMLPDSRSDSIQAPATKK